MLTLQLLYWLVDMYTKNTNPFFNSVYPGQSGEQSLLDDLVIEQIAMFGADFLYMPRKMLNLDKLLHESSKNAFEFAMPIPMYVKTFSGYNNGMEMLTKFGVRASDEVTLVMSRSVWNTSYAPFVKAYYNAEAGRPTTDDLKNLEGETSRPKEGDLIYFPFDDGIFEIKYVQFDQPFFQLGRGYVYELMCEKFEFSGESFETGYEEVDQAKTVPDYYRMEFILEEGGTGSFKSDERIKITDFTNVIDLITEDLDDLTTEQRDQLVVDEVFRLYNDPGYLEHVAEVQATVTDFDKPHNKLVVNDLTNLDPDQLDDDYNVDINKFDTVIIEGLESGAVYASIKAHEHLTAFNDNEIIQEEFDAIKIIDDPWDESPFGFV